jgi:hypothetical protein
VWPSGVARASPHRPCARRMSRSRSRRPLIYLSEAEPESGSGRPGGPAYDADVPAGRSRRAGTSDVAAGPVGTRSRLLVRDSSPAGPHGELVALIPARLEIDAAGKRQPTVAPAGLEPGARADDRTRLDVRARGSTLRQPGWSTRDEGSSVICSRGGTGRGFRGPRDPIRAPLVRGRPSRSPRPSAFLRRVPAWRSARVASLMSVGNPDGVGDASLAPGHWAPASVDWSMT